MDAASPRARRRDRSASVSLQTTIPTPISVQIFNLFAASAVDNNEQRGGKNISATATTSAKSKTPRLEYSTQLLCPIQAELVQVSSSSSSSTTTAKSLSASSSHDATATVNTTTTSTAAAKDKVLYTFDTSSSVDGTCTTSPCWAHLAEALDWDSLDRAVYERIHIRFRLLEENDDNDNDENAKSFVFLSCPLHPSKLVPLQKNLPPNRPVNTVVVQFSDESLRIPRHILEQFNPQESALLAVTENLRFAEDAFTALDTVVTSNSSLPASSLLDAYDNDEMEQQEGEAALAIHATATEVSVEVLPSPRTAEQRLTADMSHLPAESQSRIAQLVALRETWRQRVHVAQGAVQASQELLRADQQALCDTLERLRVYQEQYQQIMQATRQEKLECQRLELHLEAQRIRLVKELRRIYPVNQQATNKGIWKIRGLALPKDLFSIPDEDLSAALGLVCHAVTLLSRYLHVPLRYRLYCNSSRSAVQDDRGTVFPLFQARPVEREQVEYGVVLLERNVECICSSRGIVAWDNNNKESPHILEKVHMIYETVIEGDFASE